MVRTLICIAAAGLLAAVSPPAGAALAQAPGAGAAASPAPETTHQAADLIREKKPAEAIVVLDRIIAAQAAAHAGEQRPIYCAYTPGEVADYAFLGLLTGKGALVLDDQWCMALFLKGYALIDLDRSEEARPFLEQALAMAPGNSQFLSELGEWHKVRRNWDRAFAYFQEAARTADQSPEQIRLGHKTRALRGMGYVLIEQGKLDEAERIFRQCLDLNPNDEGAKTELEYIRRQRQRRG